MNDISKYSITEILFINRVVSRTKRSIEKNVKRKKNMYILSMHYDYQNHNKHAVSFGHSNKQN